MELPALVVRVPKTMQGSRQYVVKLSYKSVNYKDFYAITYWMFIQDAIQHKLFYAFIKIKKNDFL